MSEPLAAALEEAQRLHSMVQEKVGANGRLQAHILNMRAERERLRALLRETLRHLGTADCCSEHAASIRAELGDEPRPRTVAEAIYGSENGR